MKAITPDAKLIFMVTGPVSHFIASAAAANKTKLCCGTLLVPVVW